MKEAEYQQELIRKIENLIPGCLVLKNDPNYRQGIPDLSVFYGNRFALLEVKASARAPERPNQRWYVEEWAKTTFSVFIYPENEEEVLSALQQSLLS